MTDMTRQHGRSVEQPPGLSLVLSELLRRTVVDASGQGLGRLSDVIVRLVDDGYPVVTGLVADIGGLALFVPAAQILAWHTARLELATAKPDLRGFVRRPGEVLLRQDLLGHRLVDLEQPRLVTACDVRLTHTDEAWVVSAVDVRPRGLLRRRGVPLWRDWVDFEPLIGHNGTHLPPSVLGRLRRLKAADLADLIEEASDREQADLLVRVHGHPELEADVFEELEEGQASDLMESRSDPDIAELLTRMRADDAADAVLDLPQDRRRAVLDLMPVRARDTILVLLGYQEATAGGFMTTDYLTVPAQLSVSQAIDAVRAATAMEPQALVTVYCHDDDHRIVGAVTVVRLLQSDPAAAVGTVADADPVHVHADADLTEITLAMADYNLLTLPVLDDDDRILGILTVDDVLEATVTPEWRHMQH
jgi:CBS domain-containing protein